MMVMMVMMVIVTASGRPAGMLLALLVNKHYAQVHACKSTECVYVMQTCLSKRTWLT